MVTQAPAPHRPPAARGSAVWAVVDRATAGLFAALSRIRGRRIMHPYGRAYRATLVLTDDGLERLPPDTPRGTDGVFGGVARMSRSVGLPPPMPDVHGLAVRLPDFHGPGLAQDVLLSTSGARGVLRRVLLPTRDPLRRVYSSVLPFEIRGRRCLLGARAIWPAPPEASPGAPGLQFELMHAERGEPWRAIGVVTLGEELSEAAAEALRFHPWQTSDGIRPAGLVNRIRLAAYPGSQEGSPTR
jgi:hypothetical protein